MKQSFLSLVSIVCLQVVLLVSCSKGGGTDSPDPGPPPPPPPPDPGEITISIPEPAENTINFPYFTDTKATDIFSVSRTGSNTQANNTAVTVKVEKKDGLVTLYNNTKGTKYEVLPDSLYTTALTGTSNVYTMSFASGDLSKKFSINVNGAKWKVDHDYAIAFVINDATGGDITAKLDTVITFLGVRNKWDGVYTVTGTYADAGDPTYTANYPYEWELRTTGANQCVVWDKIGLNKPGFLYNRSSGTTFYEDFGIIINFDPATDKVSSVTNYYGQPATNTRSAELDPSGVNAYNSTAKTIDIKYFMKQPSAIPAAPNIRVRFNEKWTFKKAR